MAENKNEVYTDLEQEEIEYKKEKETLTKEVERLTLIANMLEQQLRIRHFESLLNFSEEEPEDKEPKKRPTLKREI